MWDPIVGIVVCMGLWTVAWAFFFSSMNRRKLDYTGSYLRTGAYFLGVALVTALLFWSQLTSIIAGVVVGPIIVLAVVLLATVGAYLYLPTQFRLPEKYFEIHPHREYLKIDWHRLASKSMDILAQQIFIVLIITFIHEMGFSLWQEVALFFVLFGALHIPLIVTERGAWPAWLFGVTVVTFSVAFPIIILDVHYGFVYTYLIHWLFYAVTAVVFWHWSKKQSTNGF